MHKTARRFGGLSLAVLIALTLVGIPAIPAAADHAPPPASHDPAGSGNFQGSELVEDQQLLGRPCFRVTRHVFGLRGVGTYQGRTAGGDPVVFRGEIDPQSGHTVWGDGPLRLQIENTGTYYHGPFGTHGTDSSCGDLTVGSPVPAEFRIFAAEGVQDTDGDLDVDLLTGAAWVYRLDGTGQKVPCVAHGTFARGTPGDPTFADPAWEAEWTLSEDCVVVGNEAGTPGTGTAPTRTPHTQHGSHDPCFDGVGGCTDNFKVDFAQFLAKPGPILALTGPDTVAATCDVAATVTARMTVDGWPKPGVPVTFSVAGAGPATPPGGAGSTDTDGRATFSFTGVIPGTYTVTATATHDGQQLTARHSVLFDDRTRRHVAVAGPPDGGQTEEATTVTATVQDACGPLPGAGVEFAVAWPNQNRPWVGTATPSIGAGTTDANGRATFSFTGDRAGDYTVTASTSVGSERASATGTVPLEVMSFRRVAALALPSGQTDPTATMMDPAGRYVYYVANGRLEKVDLATFLPVGGTNIPRWATDAAIHPNGRYAYVADPVNATLVKVDLEALQAVGTTPLETIANTSFVVIDPAGTSVYVGIQPPNDDIMGQVVKVDLNTDQRLGALQFSAGEVPTSAAIDGDGKFAYVSAGSCEVYFSCNHPAVDGRVIKVDLTSLQRVGTVVFQPFDDMPVSALVDPAGDYGYFGTTDTAAGVAFPGHVVKVDLRAFRRVGAITLDGSGESELEAAVMDPDGDVAHFASARTGRIIKVDLRTFARVRALNPPSDERALISGAIDPAGEYAYFGNEGNTGKLVKVQVGRPPNPALAADDESYATDYATPLTVAAPGVLEGDSDTDNDPLVATNASDPAGGSVALNPDGGFTYTPDAGFTGTDTFTYTASDGMDYSARATVSITVNAPEGLTGSAFGYFTDVSLFGGPAERRGFAQPATAPATAASPSASLPEEGSPTPISAHDPNGAAAHYGPAVIFGGIWPDDVAAGPPSGPLTASTEGNPAGGWVTSSAKAELHPSPVPVRCYGDPAGTANCTAPGGIGPGPVIAHEAHSTCTANKSGVSASARFVNGVVETKYDPETQLPVESQPIPDEPPVGYTVEGTLDHVGDSFRIVFNEQVVSAGGSIVTVNAAHMYLLGPVAVGDMVIAQSVCGAPPGANTAPDAADDTYATVAGRLLTVAAPGVLANDADSDADVLSATSASDPAGGAVALNPDGSFTYTPDAGFVGTDTFTYTASDGHGGSDSATVALTVTPPPDLRPTQLSVADTSLLEGDSGATTATFTVTRSGNTAGASTVKYKTGAGTATAGTDYTAVPLTTLSFAAGETTKAVSVNVAGDTLPEPNETLTLVLSAPTGAVLADASGTATVRNDDGAAYLGVDNVTVTEGNEGTTPATFTVTRSGNTTGASTVKYKTATGTAGADDFAAVALSTLSFAPGETTKTLSVNVTGDTVDEKNEAFTLALSAPAGATVADAAGTATIVDDEGTITPGPATFVSVNSVWVPEGNTGATPALFTLTRTGDTTGASAVKYTTSGGTATSGTDYTKPALTTVNFAAGEATKTVAVEVAGDGLSEADETFNLTLSAPTGAVIADAAGTATIVNDDGAAYVGVDNIQVSEGNTGATTATFTVSRSGNTSGSSTVKIKTSGGTATAGTDYTAISLTTIDFAPGETSRTVSVDVTGDTAKEANETFNLVLSTPSSGTVLSDASGAATIVTDD